MSRANELVDKAARLRQRQTPPPVESVDTDVLIPVSTDMSSGAGAVRVKPVRLTVDVSPADHAALGRWALDGAADLGLARVHGQELVRGLIRRALTDEHLRAAVLADIAATRNAQ